MHTRDGWDLSYEPAYIIVMSVIVIEIDYIQVECAFFLVYLLVVLQKSPDVISCLALALDAWSLGRKDFGELRRG